MLLTFAGTIIALYFGVANAAPEAVDRTEPERQCPEGYVLTGKICTKKAVTAPIVGCTPGFSYVDGRCISYGGMAQRCPDELQMTELGCVREDQTSPVLGCDNGYSLTLDDRCITVVQLPEVALCPPGSKVKGDKCVREVLGEPVYVCAPGYTVSGKRCISEVLYDCTPERNGTEAMRTLDHFTSDSLRARARQIRLAQLSKHDAPSEHSYVVSATCKRVINEPAGKRCPEGSGLVGKQCLLETVVEPVKTDGGQETIEGDLNYQCPIEYSIVTDAVTGEVICSRSIVRPPILYCTIGVEENGRCRVEMKPLTTCKESYKLNNETLQCETLLTAEPIVQYTVRYACTGKNCENNAGSPLRPR